MKSKAGKHLSTQLMHLQKKSTTIIFSGPMFVETLNCTLKNVFKAKGNHFRAKIIYFNVVYISLNNT